MKRSALVVGIVTALMIPASLAVAQNDDAPVMKQSRLGDGNQADCSYYLEKGEPQMVRLHEGTRTQTGARWGDGPMGSEEAPFQRHGFGPGECDGECEGEGPFGPRADDPPYGPFGDQDGSGAGYGPGEAGNGAGPQNGEGPLHQGPGDGSGSQFGNGPGSNGAGNGQGGNGTGNGRGGNA